MSQIASFDAILLVALVWGIVSRIRVNFEEDLDSTRRLTLSVIGMSLLFVYSVFKTVTTSSFLIGSVASILVPVVWFFGPYVTMLLVIVFVALFGSILVHFAVRPLDKITNRKYSLVKRFKSREEKLAERIQEWTDEAEEARENDPAHPGKIENN